MKRTFLILCLFGVVLAAQPKIDKIRYYATDYSNTLTREEIAELNRQLQSIDEETSNQVVVLMIASLDGYPIDMLANEIAEENAIGRKGRDNGVLVLVSKNDKKIRIEVGYGLEGSLPDALASSIIRNEIAPYFKSGKYFEGLNAGIRAISAATKGEYTNEDKRKQNQEKDGIGFPIIYIIIFILLAIFGRGGKGGGLGALLLLGALGGGRSHGGGFSGGGGFGGGGFSGGGGGFGGGGSSGGW